MDRVTQGVIAALREELQKTLEALGDFPKKEAFDHGYSVGVYHGLKKSLDVIEEVLSDRDRREAEL